MKPAETLPGWEPIGLPNTPTGFVAPAQLQRDRQEFPKLCAIAARVINDPLQVQRLVTRIHQLMQADLQRQRERQGHYGGRY